MTIVLNATCAEKIRVGDVVEAFYAKDGGWLVRSNTASEETIAGIALHDIAEGEIVEFSPNGNTADIATKVELLLD